MNSIHCESVSTVLEYQTLLMKRRYVINWNGYWYSITPESLEACHHLQDDEMTLLKKSKAIRASILVVLILKLVQPLSRKVFVATENSYGINAKWYGQSNGLKLSGLATAKSKSELNLKAQFLQKLFPSYHYQF